MFLAFTALLLIPTVSYGQSFRALNPQVQQGDVMIFRIAPQWQAPAVVNPAIAIFGKHYLPNKYGYVFVGIDKSIAPGKHTATLVEYGRGVRLSIDYQEVEISERIYQIRKRTPGKPRNSKEVEAIKNAYAKGSPSESYVDSDFTLPLDKIVIDKDRVVGDVSSPFGGESHRGVDLITLDLPEPWRCLDHAQKALRSGGFLVSYSPHITQALQLVNQATDHGFLHLKTQETIERPWVVQGQKARPEYQILGHTGFLTFLRKI